jgi:hypothetical protein
MFPILKEIIARQKLKDTKSLVNSMFSRDFFIFVFNLKASKNG